MSENNTTQRICPVEKAGGLDNAFRRFLQDPQKILQPYIKEGMTVLDLGCGPGFFTIEIAKMLSESGKVLAADLQEGMLEKLRRKMNGTNLQQRIVLHKCSTNGLLISEKVDFILAFYVVHEIPDHKKLFKELKSVLKADGQMLILEPKAHVSKKSFVNMLDKLEYVGFSIKEVPNIFFSRAILVH